MKFAIFLLILAGINSTFGNIFLKKSSLTTGVIFPFLNINVYFIIGLVFYGLNVLLFSAALKHISVSIAYPILAAIGSVFLVFCANFMFSEPITNMKILGIFIILIGIIILYFEM